MYIYIIKVPIRPIIICVKSVHVNLYAYMCPCPARTISTVRLDVRVRSGYIVMYSKKIKNTYLLGGVGGGVGNYILL